MDKLPARSWAQLSAKIPKATLSRLLNELIKDGYIKPELKINSATGKRETVYVIVEPWQPSVSIPNLKRFSIKTPGGEEIDQVIIAGKDIQRTRGRKSYFRLSSQEKALLDERTQKALSRMEDYKENERKDH
jgi:hypothetical protein